jgi:hypothetical protein
MTDNIIYALYDPYCNQPVYVGQSIKGFTRPFEHIKEKSHSDKVNEWVQDLKKDGKSPVLVILEHDCSPDLLNDKELFWIQRFIQKGFPLLNQVHITVKFIINKFLIVSNIDDDYLIEVKKYIKYKRKLNKLTQQDLADRSGVGIRFVREIENLNSKNNFNTGSIQKILNLFGGKLIVG